MTEKKIKIAHLCEQALRRVDEAVATHQRGEDADLSIAVLKNVRSEIEKMQDALDVSVYKPGYPHFILDSWEDKHGLVNFLVEVAYQYEKLSKK